MSNNVQVICDDLIKKQGDKYTITDINGKVINASINDIIDVSTDLGKNISNLNDSYSETLANFKPTITDSEGATITDSDLLDTVKSGKAIALDVMFEATHSGENLNNAVYTSASLENDAKTWLFPFKKPLIKNHDMYEEPIGRTVDAHFGQSEIEPNRDCIDVTYRVSDTDAMTKFADGRYKTMSIGATSGYIRCNVCGKDILKDGKIKFCGHWKGETYANQKATWTVENMTFREGSIVNAPADVYAQVKSIRVVTRKEDNAMKDNKDTSALDAIDSILNGDVADNQEGASQEGANNTEEPTATQNDENQTEGEGSVSVEDQLAQANAKISELEDKINTLTSEKEAVETKLQDSENNMAIVNTDNEALKSNLTKVKDQAKRMAEFNLSLMKDNLMELNPELSDAELEGKSAKEVNDMINEIKEKSQTRQTSSVTNPGLAVKDAKHDVNDGEEEPKQKLTMKDMEDEITNMWNI